MIWKKYSILLLLFGGVITGCHKEMNWTLPPNRLFLQITESGVPVPDSVLTKLKVYYWDAGKKVSRPPANYHDSSFVNLGIRHLGADYRNMGLLASGYIGPGHDWLIEYPDGEIDTLYVETTNLDAEEGRNHRCYCNAPFTVVRINGRDLPEATGIDWSISKPVFLRER
jgi:hypothetical protein